MAPRSINMSPEEKNVQPGWIWAAIISLVAYFTLLLIPNRLADVGVGLGFTRLCAVG